MIKRMKKCKNAVRRYWLNLPLFKTSVSNLTLLLYYVRMINTYIDLRWNIACITISQKWKSHRLIFNCLPISNLVWIVFKTESIKWYVRCRKTFELQIALAASFHHSSVDVKKLLSNSSISLRRTRIIFSTALCQTSHVDPVVIFNPTVQHLDVLIRLYLIHVHYLKAFLFSRTLLSYFYFLIFYWSIPKYPSVLYAYRTKYSFILYSYM